MKVVKGDLVQLALLGHFDVIVHGCNCFHTMGAGIARTIKRIFPEAYLADCQSVEGSEDKMGTYTYTTIDNKLIVVNAYTQYDFGLRRSRDGQVKPAADYHAIQSVFARLKRDFPELRIGYPKIGAGLAGGDWKLIANIIDHELQGMDHTLVLFDQEPKRNLVSKAKATSPVVAAKNEGASNLGKKKE